MNILIYTPSFYPNTGGLETINYLIAKGLSQFHNVVVVTPILRKDDSCEYGFRIVRTNRMKDLWHEYKYSDIFLHSVLSLKGIFPLFLRPKPWVVIHHTCYFRVWDQGHTISSRLKQFFSKFAQNICVSDAVGKNLALKHYYVIHNSYNNTIFKHTNESKRTGFVFVGRLVTEKGVDCLIKAYQIYIHKSKIKEALYIIGDGPMMKAYKDLTDELGLTPYIAFEGLLQGEDLSKELNRRKCMVVPSVYKEAFGIVALEGLASGCLLIGSDGDGISEAIGGCGYLFKKGDFKDLAEQMLKADLCIPCEKQMVVGHLAKFTPEYMIQQYLNILQQWGKKS